MFKILLVVLFILLTSLYKMLFVHPYSDKKLLGKLSPAQFAEKNINCTFYLPSAILKLYGKELSKVFDNWHSFEKAIWYEECETLEIFFKENVVLRIKKPGDIEERMDRIVIWHAEEITWEWNCFEEIASGGIPYRIEILDNKGSIKCIDRRGLLRSELSAIPKEKPAIELVG